MATHKVPQDVEAEDKLIGFLSLKQFISTLLGLGFGYLTFFFFANVHPVTSVVWILPTIVFLVLGLYQRKDQPVEVFLASAIRFYIKPHKRIWSLEGYEERVVVTAPPKVEHHYTKNFTGEEATSRLTNLSRLMDSRGWATKLASDFQNPQLATAAASERLVQPGQLQNSGINIQAYMQPVDVMDENSSVVAQGFQSKIVQNDVSAKQHAIQTLQQARQSVVEDSRQTTQTQIDYTPPTYQQYPTMHQKIVSPAETAKPESPQPPEPETGRQEAPEAQVIQNETPPRQPIAQEPAPNSAPKITPDKPIEDIADDGSVEIRLH